MMLETSRSSTGSSSRVMCRVDAVMVERRPAHRSAVRRASCKESMWFRSSLARKLTRVATTPRDPHRRKTTAAPTCHPVTARTVR